METGELLTRGTIWLAVCAYAVGAAMMLSMPERSSLAVGARWAWTAGCALFLAHVACAFAYYHGWSHGAAYEDTARQTAEMTGWRWGGGLFLNYLLAGAWLADVLWWWVSPGSHAQRSPRLTAIWHGFFFFMVFNGAVIFVRGPMRWMGAVICTTLVVLWWRKKGRKRGLAL